MLENILASPQEHTLSPWKQWFLECVQRIIVHYGPLGLPRMVWSGRHFALGTGLRLVSYLGRFQFLCDCDSWYSVMRASGAIHRCHDRVINTLCGRIEGDVVLIDVGANEGFVSLLACSAVGSNRTVYSHCFEPNPIAFQALALNASLNPFHMALNKLALGEEAGSATLLLGACSGNSTMLPNGISHVSVVGKELVNVETLDVYCSERSLIPNVIKIDVEGYEPYVLQGASQIIEQIHPYLIVEINSRALSAGGSSASSLFDLLSSHGYRLFYVDDQAVPSEKEVRRRQSWQGYAEVYPRDFVKNRISDVLAVPY